MDNYPLLWFFITIFCIACQGFYSMVEMAAVSFNRVRLEYYVSRGIKRMIWLQYLLKKPSRLFGTIMLGVNIALQIGSQSAREFYRSIHIDPDFAPITQIFLVVIFAELAPLFAARRYAEHVAMFGIPIVYFTYRIFAPFIWCITMMMRLFYRLIRQKEKEFDVFISRDELQKVLESHDEEGEEFNLVVANIFSLQNKTAASAMTPLEKIQTVRSSTTIAELRKKMRHMHQLYIPLSHKSPSNIIAIAFPGDLLRASDTRLLRDFARPSWFITGSSKLSQILQQFRRNKQSVAVVLDDQGSAIGILTLEEILEEIFGEMSFYAEKGEKKDLPLIQRTLPGNTKIADFNKEYDVYLESHGAETLAQLMMKLFDHIPVTGDAVVIDRFELIVEEASILGIKSVSVRSLGS